MVDKSSVTLPVALIILDGFGIAPSSAANAITQAKKPCIDSLLENCSHTQLLASGTAVGLPEGQMGNSEVGHLNIGAGQVVYQELTRINNACDNGTLQENEVLRLAFQEVARKQATAHLMGLLSDGGVHSSNKHLYALIRMAKQCGVHHVHVHCFLDGRDVPPQSAIDYIQQLETYIASEQTATFSAKIASISGRYYAMDRDNRWDRTKRAFNAIVNGSPYIAHKSAQDVIRDSYAQGITDEFVEPVSLCNSPISKDDAVVFFNFRPDRARQLTRAFIENNFQEFKREEKPNVSFVCLTQYDASFNVDVAFPKELPSQVLADVLAQAGLTQYHTAETEKYAHVTFFLNGGVEQPKHGELRKLIPSPKVATYDLQPAMSAPKLSNTLAQAIRNNTADVYIVNFANCDMVGHTGVMQAAINAVEAVDAGVAEVLDALKSKGGVALVTADHGNADIMKDNNGNPFTAHTTNPVPFVLVDYSGSSFALEAVQGSLCDIAPTLLNIIGLPVPKVMTGRSLLKRVNTAC